MRELVLLSLFTLLGTACGPGEIEWCGSGMTFESKQWVQGELRKNVTTTDPEAHCFTLQRCSNNEWCMDIGDGTDTCFVRFQETARVTAKGFDDAAGGHVSSIPTGPIVEGTVCRTKGSDGRTAEYRSTGGSIAPDKEQGVAITMEWLYRAKLSDGVADRPGTGTWRTQMFNQKVLKSVPAAKQHCSAPLIDVLDESAVTGCSAFVASNRVTFENGGFVPRCASIALGQSVEFVGPFTGYTAYPNINPGLFQQTEAGSPLNPIPGTLSGASKTVTFTTSGDFPYFAYDGNSNVTGTIRVR